MTEKKDAVDEKKKSRASKGESLTLLSGFALVLLGAALFGIGRAYRDGYLYKFGLDAAQIPEDFNGYMYWGYLGGLPLLVGWLVILFIVFLIYAVLAWSTGELARNWGWLRSIRKWWEEDPSQRETPAHTRFIALAICAFALGYIIVVVSYVVPQAREAGMRQGSKELNVIDTSSQAGSNGAQWIEIVLGEADARTEAGYRLLCSDKLCSIYDPSSDNAAIRVIPLDDLREIRVFDRKPATIQGTPRT